MRLAACACVLAVACSRGLNPSTDGNPQLDAGLEDAMSSGDGPLIGSDADTDAGASPPWIAFVSNRTGNFDIYLVHEDGSDLHAVAQDPANEFFPRWAPDGHTIAFSSNRTGAYQLYLLDVATDAVTPITTGLTASTSPTWSPDAQTLAFAGTGGLYTVARAGGTATPLTTGGFRDNLPDWAADGRIFFASDRSGVFDVWAVNADGSGLAQITTGTNIIGGPTVSPDVKTVALTKAAGTELIFWSLETGTPTSFSTTGDYESAFSADGARLAVTSTRYAANNPEVVLLGVPGAANPLRITDDPGVDGQAALQPAP